jgi:hypothetical protein
MKWTDTVYPPSPSGRYPTSRISTLRLSPNGSQLGLHSLWQVKICSQGCALAVLVPASSAPPTWSMRCAFVCHPLELTVFVMLVGASTLSRPFLGSRCLSSHRGTRPYRLAEPRRNPGSIILLPYRARVRAGLLCRRAFPAHPLVRSGSPAYSIMRSSPLGELLSLDLLRALSGSHLSTPSLCL